MKKQFLFLGVVALSVISCNNSNNNEKGAEGAWISSVFSETYQDQNRGAISNSYDFKSTLVVNKGEFLWDQWGEYGTFELSPIGTDLKLSLQDKLFKGDNSWQLKSCSADQLTFEKQDELEGKRYNSKISFDRL